MLPESKAVAKASPSGSYRAVGIIGLIVEMKIDKKEGKSTMKTMKKMCVAMLSKSFKRNPRVLPLIVLSTVAVIVALGGGIGCGPSAREPC